MTSSFPSLSRKRPPGNREAVAWIKSETRSALTLGEDISVSVSELSCSEAGCPDVETVVALFQPGIKPRVFRMHKPIIEVTIDDLKAVLLTAEN